MTEFEQQVADALWGPVPEANVCPGCGDPTAEPSKGWWHSRCLASVNRRAPRVAAAILATRDAAHRAHQGADMMAYVHGARWTDEDRAKQVALEEAAALAALRGETP